MSVQFDYLISQINLIKEELESSNPKVLDFGSGKGNFVHRGMGEGLDIYGADPYPNRDEYRRIANSNVALKDRVREISGGKVDFPDSEFDIVISNMVFEHVENLDEALSEIKRVLKPGGKFLALFPTEDCWWEGHCKLYFAHWFSSKPRVLKFYLKLMKRLGFGEKTNESPEVWATRFEKYFKSSVFYRSKSHIIRSWKNKFGEEPDGLESDYILFRLRAHRKLKPYAGLFGNDLMRFLLKILCVKRATRVLLVSNNKGLN